MNSRSALAVANDLRDRQRSLTRYISRIERSVKPGYLAKSDMKHAYAGAVLAYFDAVESSLERLFIGLLVGSLTCKRNVTRRVDVRSHQVAREVIRGDRRYVDWLPFDKTIERANLFFRGGEPYSRLTLAQKEPLERLRLVRNAIAHGDHAQTLFERQLIAPGTPVAQRHPVGWLRGAHNPTHTRFDNLLVTAGRSIRDLCQ